MIAHFYNRKLEGYQKYIKANIVILYLKCINFSMRILQWFIVIRYGYYNLTTSLIRVNTNIYIYIIM